MVLHCWFIAHVHDASPSVCLADIGLAQSHLRLCHANDRQWLSVLPKRKEASWAHQEINDLRIRKSILWSRIHPQLPTILADHGNLRDYAVWAWSTNTVPHRLAKLFRNLCVWAVSSCLHIPIATIDRRKMHRLGSIAPNLFTIYLSRQRFMDAIEQVNVQQHRQLGQVPWIRDALYSHSNENVRNRAYCPYCSDCATHLPNHDNSHIFQALDELEWLHDFFDLVWSQRESS